LGHYDVFVGIMWKRFGTPTGKAGSGTEHEFRSAAAQLGKPDAPRILFYICERPFYPNDEDLTQMPLVKVFRSSLQSNGILTPYVEVEQFAVKLEEHLIKIIYQSAQPKDKHKEAAPESAVDHPQAKPARPTVRSISFDAPKRSRELNPLEKVPGRTLCLELRADEAEYICSYSMDHNFVPKLSRREREEFVRPLLDAAPKTQQKRINQFLISRYPVTNEQFELLASQRDDYKTTAERDRSESTWWTAYQNSGPKHPVTNVSFRDAQEFCSWAGVRLPTREEYERCVRGLSDSLFPWGPTWEPDHCNDMFYLGDRTTSPVDAFRDFSSSDGICASAETSLSG
jgi:formylglycine-generating enzyme required for sulfatase activity